MKIKLTAFTFFLIVPFLVSAQLEFIEAPASQFTDLRKIVKLDIINFYDNNPALLFEYDHQFL